MKNLQNGQIVRVRDYAGRELVRRVVFVRKDIVAVCCEDEFQQARKEGRPPSAIGFRSYAVVGIGISGH